MVIGPITLEAKVHFARDEDDIIGSASVGLAPGKPATLEALHVAIGQTIAALPDGCRLLGPDEFFNKVLVREKTGRVGHFATPADFHYDVAELTKTARAAYIPEPAQEPNSEIEDDDWDEEEDEDDDG